MPISLTGTPELLGDRERDAALGRAVELGEHDAVDLDGLAEQQRLAQAVLAGGGVDREQRLVRGARESWRRSPCAPCAARPSGAAGCAGGRPCRRSRRRGRAPSPASIASKTTAPGSEPGSPRTSSQPARSAQPRAARRRRRGTCRPPPAAPSGPSSRCRCQAILPIVVVLPRAVDARRRGSRSGCCGAGRSCRRRPGAVSASSSRSRRVRSSPPASSPASASLSRRSTIARRGGRADVGVDQRLLEALEGLVVEVWNIVACSSAPSAWRRLATCSRAGGGRSPGARAPPSASGAAAGASLAGDEQSCQVRATPRQIGGGASPRRRRCRPGVARACARPPARRRRRPCSRRRGVSAASIVRFWWVTTMNCARSE